MEFLLRLYQISLANLHIKLFVEINELIYKGTLAFLTSRRCLFMHYVNRFSNCTYFEYCIIQLHTTINLFSFNRHV